MLTALEVLRKYVAALGMALTGFGGFTGLLSLSVNRQQLGSCARTFRQAVRGVNLPGISPEVICSGFFIQKKHACVHSQRHGFCFAQGRADLSAVASCVCAAACSEREFHSVEGAPLEYTQSGTSQNA